MARVLHGMDVRLDKWLWAARFFKNRGIATEAVAGGKVHVNDARVKPARPVRTGDRIRILRGVQETVVVVTGLSDVRRGAADAALLYEETPESAAAREERRAALRASSVAVEPGRPTKRDRRELRRLRGR